MTFELAPGGPFGLLNTSHYFGGWLTLTSDSNAIVMAFSVEGWQTSAAVVLRQDGSGRIRGDVRCDEKNSEAAWRQALATLSLDYDASGWGVRVPKILARLIPEILAPLREGQDGERAGVQAEVG